MDRKYFSYVYLIDSKNVYKIITGSELRKLYFSYHTFDSINTIDRILETKSIVLDRNENQMIKDGVKILRKMKKKRNDEIIPFLKTQSFI